MPAPGLSSKAGEAITLRASKLPMLAQSPCFESGTGSEFAEAGRDRHEAFAAALRGDVSLLELLPEDEIDKVKWAIDYVKLKQLADEPLVMEQAGSYVFRDFSEITGTMDAASGPLIFDLKWRERDYTAQMAVYALIRLAELRCQVVWVYLLFAEQRRMRKLTFTKQSALAEVEQVRNRVLANTAFIPGNYCGWCSRRVMCPALTAKAKEVAEGYAGSEDEKLVKNWHPSQMVTAEQVAAGLTIARKILKPWIESMEFHARQMAERENGLPGYKWQERNGKKFCADVYGAFHRLDLPAPDFLAACDLRLNTSKKYPERKGLLNIVAEKKGLPLASARRETLRSLSEVLVSGKPSRVLVAVKGEIEEEEN